MLLETETFHYMHYSLKIAQWFGILGIVPRLLEDRRVELNGSNLFWMYSWLPRLGNFVGLYVVAVSLVMATYMKFVKGILSYTFWIFWIGFLIVVILNILLDHVFRSKVGLICYACNCGISFVDKVDGKYIHIRHVI